jgi:hypothetical protein
MHQDAEVQYQYFAIVCYVIQHESLEIGPILWKNTIGSEGLETVDWIWLKLAQDLVKWQAFKLPMLDSGILLQ